MSSFRVLITGVGGFVGSHLSQHLAASGDTVLGLGVEPIPQETARRLAGQWHADIADVDALERALREGEPDAIVHLAAQSSAARSFAEPIETYRVNAVGTVALLEAVRRAAPVARVLAVGTSEIYGPQPSGTHVREDAVPHPVSPYAFSKLAADAACEHYAGRGLHLVRTRSFGHIGPGQADVFFVPSLARQIAEAEAGRGRPVVRVGNLDVTRDLTDVRDVVRAYRLLLEQGRSGEAYNLCRGTGTSLRELARRLLERSTVPLSLEVDPARMRPADIPYLVGDPARIHRDTGWQPAIPLEQTLDDTLEDWRLRVRAEQAS